MCFFFLFLQAIRRDQNPPGCKALRSVKENRIVEGGGVSGSAGRLIPRPARPPFYLATEWYCGTEVGRLEGSLDSLPCP